MKILNDHLTSKLIILYIAQVRSIRKYAHDFLMMYELVVTIVTINFSFSFSFLAVLFVFTYFKNNIEYVCLEHEEHRENILSYESILETS